jgi:hypothetical protein
MNEKYYYPVLETATGIVFIGLGALANANGAYLGNLGESIGFSMAYYGLDNIIG